MDLITLDSPFPPDGSTEEPMANHDDFEDIWNSFDASCDIRGWCSASIDNVTRRLQCVEHYRLAVIATELSPFIGRSSPLSNLLTCLQCPIGELKIMMVANTAPFSRRTLIRLREIEEDSCLWRLRCEDHGFRAHVQTLLT